MLTYPNLDPVAFHIGPLAVNWYGLMYLIGFTLAWGFLRLRLQYSSFKRGFTPEELSDILFYSALGTIIGGRVGYMVFYVWPDLVASPLTLFAIWKGGMSFHGGLLGVAVALYLYGQKHRKAFLDMTDFIIPAVPLGLAAGRIGNFINGELWGRVTDIPWAMIFPYGGPYPRHPSQLYEFLTEGLLLFMILSWYSMKPRPRGAVSGLFLICYGFFRFIIEFWREPDVQKGFVAWGWLTQGQLLCLPMVFFGIILMVCAFKRCQQKCDNI